jgi:hypothetical protein
MTNENDSDEILTQVLNGGNFSVCKSATLDLFLRRNAMIANELACQIR